MVYADAEGACVVSRSGYTDDLDGGDLNLWRGAVRRAMRGKRGQAFLREMLAGMDAMPEKALIAEQLVTKEGDVCAMGVVCKARGLDASLIDYEDGDSVAAVLGIAPAMAKEISYENDECGPRSWQGGETPGMRFMRMRAWVAKRLLARGGGA